VSASRLKLLIIDDSHADRLLYRRLLTRRDASTFTIYEAETGEEGLELLYRERPDCVLLDYQLPDTDGLELLGDLRAGRADAEAAPMPPVIMLTGQGDESVAVAAMQAGALNYLVKGELTRERLAQAIGSAIEKVQLQAQLEQKVRELEERNRELQAFASVIAHDLRAPLQAILLTSETLLDMHGDAWDDTTSGFLQVLASSASRMNVLLSDLLEYARAGLPEGSARPVDLGLVLAQLTQDLAATVASTGGRVEVGEMPWIHGHETRLRQLFQNLIGNALKFRGAEPPVVRVEARLQDRDWQIAVSDNGVGIAPEHFETIFGVFQRGPSAELFEGTGIGLAICRRIADQHGGQITVESTPGEGTTFRVLLPGHAESPV